MKRKSKRKKNKPAQMRKVLVLLFIGIGLFLLYSFRGEVSRWLTPGVEKEETAGQKRIVTLYFSDPEGEYLIGEKREILKARRVEEEMREMVVELTKGPRGKLVPTLPARTKLLGIELGENGLAKIDFSKALAKDHPGGSTAEMMTVYSVVNSLTLNYPQIRKVQILVEGKKIETIAGHLSLGQPISSKTDLIKKAATKRGAD
jgi:spore germination protein GerM